MLKEYLFYLYVSWKKEKGVVIVDNSKMRKDFFFFLQEWTVFFCNLIINEHSKKIGLARR